MTYKELQALALELLAMYGRADASAIYEASTNIGDDIAELEKHCENLRAKINLPHKKKEAKVECK